MQLPTLARKRYWRYVARGIPVASVAELPASEESFLVLLDHRNIKDDDNRAALLALFLLGVLILYLEPTGEWVGLVDGELLAPDDYEMWSVYNSMVDRRQRELMALASRLRRGEITLDEFEAEMMATIREAHETAALLVVGPLWALSARALEFVGAMIAREMMFLRRLIDGIRNGTIRLDGRFARRAAMYAGAGRYTYQQLRNWWAADRGYTHEINILGQAEHCRECLFETAKGIVPIGSLSMPGTRECVSNCKCHLRYFRAEDIMVSDSP